MKNIELFKAWQKLLINLSAMNEVGLDIWEDIEALYGEDGRYYHTLDHIKAVLETIAEMKPLAQDYYALQLAAWFHDIIYNPKFSNNEIQSVVYTESLLMELFIPRKTIQKVSQMIVATAEHINPAGDPDTDILLDADLAILGSDEARFRWYCEAIRKEYSWVAEADYRKGRIGVLEGFLARDRIYRTGLMNERLEERARENLVGEVERLGMLNNEL